MKDLLNVYIVVIVSAALVLCAYVLATSWRYEVIQYPSQTTVYSVRLDRWTGDLLFFEKDGKINSSFSRR